MRFFGLPGVLLGVFFAAVAMPVLIFSTGCNATPGVLFSPNEEDKLTQDELNELIFHARNFIKASKKLKLRDEERTLIETEAPTVTVNYTNYKEGKLTLEWRLQRNRVIQLFSHGEFLRKRPNWSVQLKTEMTRVK